MPLISTTKRIAATPDAVFAVLADFAHYAAWNPLNLSMDGECRVGARVRTRAFSPLNPARPVDLAITITRCEPGRALAWVGDVPFFFRGEHSFTLAPDDGGVLLTHSENITGLMPLFVGRSRILRDFTPYYAAFNDALAGRVAAL